LFVRIHTQKSIMKEMFLSLHTVFVLNENIRWLEEFLIYHIHIGFDHFYLYRNEGTNGDNGEGDKQKNRYGFPRNTDSTPEDLAALDAILAKYANYVTHILWQPKNNKGEIVYGYNESVIDCISKYGKESEWFAFMDLDEFIFSQQNIQLSDYLRSLDRSVSCVKLIQKKFLDRFLSKEKYITQEFQSIENLTIDTNWAPKNIVRCEDFLSIESMHYIITKNRTIVPSTDVLRFNHYNINNKQLQWMKGFYNRKEDFEQGKDDGMKRYRNILPE